MNPEKVQQQTPMQQGNLLGAKNTARVQGSVPAGKNDVFNL
jgi:hypothetical protein